MLVFLHMAKLICNNNWFCLIKGTQYCGKRRKCWLPAFSPFPTIFSKIFFSRVVQEQNCLSKELYTIIKKKKKCSILGYKDPQKTSKYFKSFFS